MYRIFAFFIIFLGVNTHAAITFEESRSASTTIGKWLSRSTGHFDFYSATPVAPKRAGDKFMIRVAPNKQFASDYGISYQPVYRSYSVTEAYQTLGFNTDEFSKTVNLTRFHANFGITNDYDLAFSYLTGPDNIRGWGVGLKDLLIKYRYFYLSHRIQIGRSELKTYFDNIVMINDLSMSLYFTLLDVYAGIRHGVGRVRFYSSISELNLPPINYFSKLSELEYYYGAVIATSYNTRLTLQANKNEGQYSFGLKLSFHFDSLLPTANNYFRDPRYIKQ